MKAEYIEKIILTVVGFAASGVLGLLAFYTKRILTLLRETPVQLKRITDMNITQLQVQRLNIKAMRSHSYALKEAGCNGGVDRALEHINKAEDLLNEQQAENLKTG